MPVIQITDGRSALWQWDTGVKIRILGCCSVQQCHFPTAAGLIVRDAVDNVCAVPDAALQTAGTLKVYAYSRSEDGGVTMNEFSLPVNARPKPADYIDPPDEMDSLDQIVQRVVDRIGDISGGIVEETDPTVPDWAKQQNPPVAPVQSVNGKTGDVQINASDVGALPVDSIKASASGAVVSVTDASARPAVGLVSQIVAVQEGEGDPSPDNVRPIRGWDRVQVQNDTSGQTLTADLPETVYGGSIDWVTGVLTVTHAKHVLTGGEKWSKYTGALQTDRYDTAISNVPLNIGAPYVADKNVICSHAKTAANAQTVGVYITNVDGKSLGIRWVVEKDTYASADELQAWFADQYAAGTPVTIAYKIAQPYTIQLTPQQLDMLKGANTIWSDTGNTDVVYVADLQMYIDQRIAAIAAAVVGQ